MADYIYPCYPQVMDNNYYSFHQPAPAMGAGYYAYYQLYAQYTYNKQLQEQYRHQLQQSHQELKLQELQQELLQQLQTRNHQYTPYPQTQRSQSPQPRKYGIPVSDNNVAIGSIVFLPAHQFGSINILQPDCNHELDHGGYEHPAIITHMWNERPNGGEIMTLCCMISANPRPNPRKKVSCLPISKVPKHQASTTSSTFRPEDIMYLEREGTMYKKSYILTNHVYRIPFSKLHLFDGESPWANRLSRTSYSALMAKLDLAEASWVETFALETGIRDPSATYPTLPAGVTKPKSRQQQTNHKQTPADDLDIQIRVLKRLARSRAHTI